jgi:hypothetical protein
MRCKDCSQVRGYPYNVDGWRVAGCTDCWGSSPQKDFCNNIGTSRHLVRCRRMSGAESGADSANGSELVRPSKRPRALMLQTARSFQSSSPQIVVNALVLVMCNSG